MKAFVRFIYAAEIVFTILGIGILLSALPKIIDGDCSETSVNSLIVVSVAVVLASLCALIRILLLSILKRKSKNN